MLIFALGVMSFQIPGLVSWLLGAALVCDSPIMDQGIRVRKTGKYSWILEP